MEEKSTYDKINRIGELIKEKGITQAALADKLNVSQQSVHAYCINRNQPTIKRAIKIAEILGVHLGEIFMSNPKPKANTMFGLRPGESARITVDVRVTLSGEVIIKEVFDSTTNPIIPYTRKSKIPESNTPSPPAPKKKVKRVRDNPQIKEGEVKRGRMKRASENEIGK